MLIVSPSDDQPCSYNNNNTSYNLAPFVLNNVHLRKYIHSNYNFVKQYILYKSKNMKINGLHCKFI